MKTKKTKSKSIYKKISMKYYIPAAILLLAGIFYLTPARGIVAQKLLIKGNSYFNSAGNYDLEKAAKWYNASLFADRNYSAAHYQLARVYFVQNKLKEAKSEIDQAIKNNSEASRAYYIRGLINGYAKNYPEAISDFGKFVEKSPGEWAGYNDLAWVYLKNKDYENAKTTLEKGLEVKPDNPWLLNGLGAAYHALGENDKAKEILDKASQLAGKLTINEWKMAYPGNDPSSADWDLADFKTNIKLNQGLAYNKSPKEAVIVPACSASCREACLSGCDLFKMCGDPDHGWDYHGTGLTPWSDVWVNVGWSATCCPPVEGSCNPAYNGQTVCNLPGSGLCSSGSQDGPYGTGPWTWNCNGSNGGGSASCSASKILPLALVCGSAAYPTPGSYCNKSQITTAMMCSSGATPVWLPDSAGKFNWTCSDPCYGNSISCFANHLAPIIPACGSDDGRTFCEGAPGANKCNPGIPSSVTGGTVYGDYTWTCSGQCDGAPVTCTAKGQGSCGWIETN